MFMETIRGVFYGFQYREDTPRAASGIEMPGIYIACLTVATTYE